MNFNQSNERNKYPHTYNLINSKQFNNINNTFKSDRRGILIDDSTQNFNPHFLRKPEAVIDSKNA